MKIRNNFTDYIRKDKDNSTIVCIGSTGMVWIAQRFRGIFICANGYMELYE